MFAAFDVGRKIVKQDLASELFGKAADLQHVSAADLMRLQTKMHGVPDLFWLFQTLDLFQHFFAALGALDGFFTVERF